MVAETTSPAVASLEPVLSGPQIIELQRLVREVPASQNVIDYAVRLVGSTRPASPEAPALVKEKVKWGAGSRASQALILAGKARALLHGRYNVACEDVRALAIPVLRHRVIPNFHADAEGVTATDIVRRLVETVRE